MERQKTERVIIVFAVTKNIMFSDISISLGFVKKVSVLIVEKRWTGRGGFALNAASTSEKERGHVQLKGVQIVNVYNVVLKLTLVLIVAGV